MSAPQIGGLTDVRVLISPNTQLTSETPLTIEVGKQAMVMAFGLQEGDEVVFEMLSIELARPISPCAPVVTPSVSDVIMLDVKLTKEKPYIIMDSPQAMPIRTTLVLANEDDVADTQTVIAREVNVQAINERMRGY